MNTTHGNYDPGKYRNIFVTGIDKASGSTTRALEELLGERMKKCKQGIS